MAYYGAGVEYALHVLLNLSGAPAGTAPSAKELAEFQRLPAPFVRKLLTQLEKARLVTSKEGVRGGWQLARPANEITLLEAAEAVQPGSPLFDCQEIRQRCVLWADGEAPLVATAGLCEIHAAMRAAEVAMRRELAARTIADIARQVEAKRPRGSVAGGPAWFEARYAARTGTQQEERNA